MIEKKSDDQKDNRKDFEGKEINESDDNSEEDEYNDLIIKTISVDKCTKEGMKYYLEKDPSKIQNLLVILNILKKIEIKIKTIN